MDDVLEVKRLQKFSQHPLEGRGWRQAFLEMTHVDLREISSHEAVTRRNYSLRHALELSPEENVDAAAKKVKEAILTILRRETTFRADALKMDKMRLLLNGHLIRLAIEGLPNGKNYVDQRKRVLQSKKRLADLLSQVAFNARRSGVLMVKLEDEGLKMNRQALRFLISEINRESPVPRILGLIREFREDSPEYVALPEGKYGKDFLTVCRIFDH